MHKDYKTVLIQALPFAGITIPSIQLPILEGYLKERDINIKTRHLYLKAAEFYGLKNYNFLINSPNDSYTAQMIFAKYVFPDHWTTNEYKFREYFEKQVSEFKGVNEDFTFERYVQQTDNFYNWAIETVEWRDYDIIGFTLNYGQLLPSLAIAKKIKELDPEKKIIFGGSRTINEIGIKTLEAFEYVDFIISGEGEEPLYRLASDFQNHKFLPNLIYRAGEEIIWNKSDDFIDLNNLPFPSFSSFYSELTSTSEEIQQYFHLYGRIPIEISRGCWWNQCSFCNLKAYHKTYREKDFDRLIEEIIFLSNEYKMLTFQLLGNTLPKKNYRALFEKLRELGRDFTFYVEARAGKLKSEDYTLLKNAGFSTIQTGIETFSQHYLEKINKGVRVIDNIAALKFCKENDIKNSYNIIVNYPNEEEIDFEETKKNTQHFKQFLDPPHISHFVVSFGSPIYENPALFNIERLEYTTIDKLMFPIEYLEKGLSFFYSYKKKIAVCENKWDQFVNDWRDEREKLQMIGIKTQKEIDTLIFYFVDGGEFIKIYDKRNTENTMIYVLNKLERDIFLSCMDVVVFQELQEKFSYVSEDKLLEILQSFVQNGIVFREDKRFLSLPLRYGLIASQKTKKESEGLLYISGIKRTL